MKKTIKTSGKTTSQGDNVLPYWDEERNGVVIPLIDKVLYSKNLSTEKKTWPEAMQLAELAGVASPTKKEMYILLFFKDEINAILKEHGGDLLEGWYWSSSEFSAYDAWIVDFPSGHVCHYYKITASSVRAVFKIASNLK